MAEASVDSSGGGERQREFATRVDKPGDWTANKLDVRPAQSDEHEWKEESESYSSRSAITRARMFGPWFSSFSTCSPVAPPTKAVCLRVVVPRAAATAVTD